MRLVNEAPTHVMTHPSAVTYACCLVRLGMLQDMVDNIVGMTLALVALATGKSSHSKV